MVFQISGHPDIMIDLAKHLLLAMENDGDYSISIQDEKGNVLALNFEADTSYEGIEWEKM